ncbi:MAG: hypothetical protein ABII00_12185 [Elusimicrobiota bacterium]
MTIFQRGIEQIAAYLPTLLAGMVLALLGLILAWLIMQVTYRLCIVLRIDRLFQRLGLRHTFEKADVRHTIYRALGALLALPIFLVFLNNALLIWKLTALSEFIHSAVLLLPRLLSATVTAGVGYLLSNLVSTSVAGTLRGEGVRRAGLLTHFVRWVLLAFFLAMALSQLDIAREVILIAFSVLMGALGLAFVVAVGMGSRVAVERAWERFLKD